MAKESPLAVILSCSERTSLSINQNREMDRKDTKIHPLSPLWRKSHPLKKSHKKIPRHMVIGLFNVKLANDTRTIGFKARINALIGNQCSI